MKFKVYDKVTEYIQEEKEFVQNKSYYESLATKALIQYAETKKSDEKFRNEIGELFVEDWLINEALKSPLLKIEGESDQDFLKRAKRKQRNEL